MDRGTRNVLASITAVSLAGCFGGGGARGVGTVPAVAPGHGEPAATSGAVFTIRVPARVPPARHAGARVPSYLSPATASVVISLVAVDGVSVGAPIRSAANVGPSAPNCTVAGGGGLLCTVFAPAAPGSDRFTVETYDAAQPSSLPSPPAGNLLSTATVTAQVQPGQANQPVVPLTLNGVVAALALAIDRPNPYWWISGQTVTATVSALDVAGNAIVGPGDLVDAAGDPVTVALTSDDVSGAVTVVTPVLPGAGTATITYNGGSLAHGRATLTASAKGIPSAAAQLAPRFKPGTFAVANASGNTVGIYDALEGNPAPYATLTAGLNAPGGIAFDGQGNLYVSNFFDPPGTTNGNNGDVAIYAPGAQSPRTTITAGIAGPGELAFDASDALYVADFNTPAGVTNPSGQGAVTVYPAGATAPSRTLTAGMANPWGVAVDAGGDLYVASLSANAVTVFTATSASPIRTITSGLTAPAGLAFDAAGDLYVANAPYGAAGSVSVFPPGGSTAATTITTGVNAPHFLAFGPSGTLVIPNRAAPGTSGWNTGSVASLPVGSSTPTYITNGTNSPVGIAFAPP